MLEATNEVATQIGDAERAAMRRHFRTTSRYEWMFWDMGYRCEQWPFEDAPAAPRRPGRWRRVGPAPRHHPGRLGTKAQTSRGDRGRVWDDDAALVSA